MDPRFWGARAPPPPPPPPRPPPLPPRAPPPPPGTRTSVPHAPHSSHFGVAFAAPPPPDDDASVDIDADALRSMPKEERRALARIAKALLACEDAETKAELAAELRKRVARARARADAGGSVVAPVPPRIEMTPRFGVGNDVASTSGRIDARAPRFGTGLAAREAEEAEALAASERRAKKRRTLSEASSVFEDVNEEERSAKDERAKRFAREAVEFSRDVAKAKGRGTPTMQEMKMMDASAVGTNTSLEKSFLRLTEAPSMATVRPPSVLARALELVCSKWRANRDYEYAKDQLKSIRQDLTVQHIRDGDLVLDTYQTHAKIALECGDLAEYNQCSAVLKSLHAHALERVVAKRASSAKGSGKKRKKSETSSKRKSFGGDEDEEEKLEGVDYIAEFAAYRLIYAAGAGSKSERAAALSRELRDVPESLKTHPFVRHAFRVCEALATNNFYRFFALHREAPRMSARLMDVIVPGIRDEAFRALLRAHAPTIPTAFITNALGFPDDDTCADHLESTHAAAFADASRAVLDVKATTAAAAAAAAASRGSVLDRLSRF